MDNELTLESFLSDNRISAEDWEAAAIEWELLQQIAEDFDQNKDNMVNCAQMIAGAMQQYPGVHSVRWRIKSTHHMLEKIVRKRAKKSPKYLLISLDNYHTTLTDLIGIRALHLFKADVSTIDRAIRENLALTSEELPIVYKRDGDRFYKREGGQLIEEVFPAHLFKLEDHPAGYRSVHYIVQSKPYKREFYAEIQVRTIFEEGWSEIDHSVRYPNHADHQMVNIFLTIFNRLAGQADEMGSFVKDLASDATETQSALDQARRENEESLERMSKLLLDLEDKNKQHNESSKSVVELKSELAKLKAAAQTAEKNRVQTLSSRGGITATSTSALNLDKWLNSISGSVTNMNDISRFAHIVEEQNKAITRAFNLDGPLTDALERVNHLNAGIGIKIPNPKPKTKRKEKDEDQPD